jgi:signal transduction histidine kinase
VEARVDADGSARWLAIVVRFEGVTFPPERLASVFDKLTQTREGLQLGRGYTLLFCREAARTLGGDVELRPWDGRGNEVTIRLPLAPVE